MRYPKVFSIAFVALLSNAISTRTQGQAIHQWLLDTVTAPYSYGKDMVLTSNGGMILGADIGGAGPRSLMRISPDGTMNWRRSYALGSTGMGFRDIQAGPENGIVGAIWSSEYHSSGTSFVTTRNNIQVGWLDEMGIPIMVRDIEIEVVYPSGSWEQIMYMNVENMPDGGIAVMATMYHSSGSHLLIFRFGSDGTLLWSRQIGATNGVDQPLNDASTMRARLINSGDGGLYVVTSIGIGPIVDPIVFRVGASGDLLWAHRVRSTQQTTYANWSGAVLTADGSIALSGAYNSYRYIYRIDANGELVDADLYTSIPPSTGQTDHLFDLGSGELFVGIDQSFLHIGSDGTPLAQYARPSFVLNGLNYTTPKFKMTVQGNRLGMLSGLYGTDPIFGIQSIQAVMETSDLTNITSGCHWTTTQPGHLQIPSGFVVSETVNTALSVAPAAQINVSDAMWQFSDLSALSISDLCTYVVGIEEDMDSRDGHLITGTLINRGDGITIDSPGKGTLEIFDALGRSVYHMGSIGEGKVVFKDLDRSNSGVYVIRWTSVSGQTVRVQRFVLE